MTAKQLTDSILQLAIQGKLVPQNPNDEPASVLLDRIREEKKRLVKEKIIKKSSANEIPMSNEEYLFDIPSTWVWCKLGWIGDWGAGATPAKGELSYYNNGSIPWLRTGELNNGFVYDSEIKVTEKALKECSLRLCNIGDVLIAMYGATIGKVAIAGIQLTTNQACCACTPYYVYNKYLLYYLIASKKRFIELGEGGAQPNISREKIISFPFSLPPLEEQYRIVEKIEELLPMIDEYGSANDELELMNAELPEKLKKSILQEAIMGKLGTQDPNDEPASVLLDRIREEKKQLVKEGVLKKKDIVETPVYEDEMPFTLPNGWVWANLSSLSIDSADGPFGSNLKKEHYTEKKEVRIIQLSNIGEDGWKNVNTKYTTYEHLNTIKRSEAFAGDIIIAKMMPAGRAIICPNVDSKFVLSSDAVRFDFSKELYKKYLYYAINSSIFKNQVYGDVQGITRVRTSLSKLRTYSIPLPPLAEQHRIVEKIEALFAEVDHIEI